MYSRRFNFISNSLINEFPIRSLHFSGPQLEESLCSNGVLGFKNIVFIRKGLVRMCSSHLMTFCSADNCVTQLWCNQMKYFSEKNQ
jgi:hypothetical protein